MIYIWLCARTERPRPVCFQKHLSGPCSRTISVVVRVPFSRTLLIHIWMDLFPPLGSVQQRYHTTVLFLIFLAACNPLSVQNLGLCSVSPLRRACSARFRNAMLALLRFELHLQDIQAQTLTSGIHKNY